MVPSLPCLAFGRVLGGVATSILFSVFESWLVSSAKSKGMTQGDIGALLGRCTLVNGIVASLAGVVSDAAVRATGTYRSPFVLSGVLLVTAGVLIRGTWEENYGGAGVVVRAGSSRSISTSIAVLRSSESISCCVRPSLTELWPVDPSLAVLGLAMTTYETSMYLFVFLFVPFAPAIPIRR
jgi:hypothetical protein